MNKNSVAFFIVGLLVVFAIALAGKWYIDQKEKQKNRIEIQTPYFKGDFSIPKENYEPLEWLK